MMDSDRFLRMNDDGGGEYLRTGMFGSSSPSRSVPISSPPSAPVGVGADGGVNHIIHTVTRFDTLAGVAIKYGVEVADIKKLNGLVTDLQMFALNTLQIPLPGRHPPSPSLSNGHETPQRPNSSHQTASSRRYSDIFDSFPSLKLKASSEEKISPAMSTLRGYYGLKPADQKGSSEGFEMAVYRKEGAHYLEDGPFAKSSLPLSNPPLSHHRKSKSLANCLASQNGDLIDRLMPQEPESNNDSAEKLVRRRQKSIADFSKCTPEKLLKNENNMSSITISSITGKGLALRPKSGSRGADGETGGPSAIPVGLGDSVLTDNGNGVRKSSSTSSLQDSENGALLSLWPTSKWSLKPDFQALSNAAIPKPSSRKNKAALD
ncbi:lysm and putative peptidoglycan-binding domain-containing protein 2 [Phtheirospermum japonicum]|uniref:Lysm and putative peptidoglycan-binding domain-containing protein 2 n=1 Tax=Phtheirospermum japonicum TaxID=374723 RepID=A0A830C870_9LAMI|nr:lysm and putative peptidoglycan-binding domain-containing protein 2 [Phtheirospermum japonicum]